MQPTSVTVAPCPPLKMDYWLEKSMTMSPAHAFMSRVVCAGVDSEYIKFVVSYPDRRLATTSKCLHDCQK